MMAPRAIVPAWRLPLCCLALLSLAAVAGAAEPNHAGVIGDTLWESLQRGGEVMYVILVASILGVAFVLEVAVRTRQGAILPKKTMAALVDLDDGQTIHELVQARPNLPAHQIFQAGHQWRNGTAEQIQYAIEEGVDENLWRLRRAARPIGIIANTTPLLGLLGTVIGIIQAFDVVARQGALGDPGALAGGISKALLTTCFGLIVAIPMLLCYHYFVGKIETLLRQCEALIKAHQIRPPAP